MTTVALKIGDFIDDGPQSITTGHKRIQANGVDLEYGPVVNCEVRSLQDRTVIEFSDPQPRDWINKRMAATISKIEVMADGSGVYAVGSWHGLVTQRKKINISFEDVP